jgi:predicted permease
MDTLLRDVRYAAQRLLRSPWYALAAIAALAIGIGANTAVFSVVDGVLFKALPYRDPQELVLLFEQLPNAPNKFGFSPPDFEIVRSLARSYSAFAGYRTSGYELSGNVTPQRVIVARITPNLFSVLGVSPLLGRSLTDEDDRQNARVAVVSYGLWTRLFGRDRFLLGNAISLDGRPFTIVGIMPQPFVFPPRGANLNGEPADVFIPMSFTPFERQAFGMQYNNTVVARLKPGVSIQQARAEVAILIQPLTERYPAALHQFAAGQSIPIAPMSEETVGSSRRMLLLVMGAVAVVLLIVCADVAGLVLTRWAPRRRELAIRAAVGATGQRIIRQLLTEAFMLAAAGSVFGLVVGYWLLRGLLLLAGERLPRVESVAFDHRVAIFTLTLAIITPLVFGIMPAFRAARGPDAIALNAGTRSLMLGGRRGWLLGSLVVGQFAMALMLSVAAGLLIRSFTRLVQTDPGFRPEQTVRATVNLPVGRYGPPRQVKAFYQRMIDAIRTVPGTVSVGAGTDLPLSVRERRAFSADASGRPIPQASRLIAVTWTADAYFEALGIPLKRGRLLTEADGPTNQRVAIINERLARLVWPDVNPIGHQIRWGLDIPQNQNPWMTVVGVVGNVKQAGLDTPAIAQAYVPLAQDDTVATLARTVNLVVRSSRNVESVMTEVRGALSRLDSVLPVTVQTLSDTVATSVERQRFSMMVMTIFAALALVLAALGVYGVLANAVAQRTREIGVHIALGATPRTVIWMVLRRAVLLMGTGLIIGTAGALATTRSMASLLFEVDATDVVSFLAAAVGLAVVALVGSLGPAWKATRVDPVVALRAE